MIDKKTVQHVALLSRLRLDEEMLDLYSRQLSAILSYINKLNEVDAKNTPPTSHVSSNLENVFRPDVVRPSLDVDEVLSNSPDKKGDFFKIPKVIEGK
jgi:aspartyl-tRNA(Asn)/glutamyl-tRNA(Gln) amidotransferase subunit C